ncbi:MAG: DUF2142 domain-containing protein [Anaerolineales bacterium]|nr:DUF2142 domain-containing protein [Anaerolineales bacterium]MCB8962436.1 DUF2142 domain-containing protein [Ardenticatenales bacterium]
MPNRKFIPITLLIIVYFVAAGLYAALTPPWQAPDEPAHYNYIRQLAEGDFPVIEAGDYDQAYQAMAIDARFDGYDVSEFEYEDWQPPLYYLIQTPFFLLSDGDLLVLRLVSVVMGAGVVLLAYRIARMLLLEEQKYLALGIAAFVALVPQHVAVLASVNNDALAELLIAAILYVLVGWLTYVNPRARRAVSSRLWWLGVLLGLGLLTKGTVYLMVPVVAGAMLWLYWGNWSGLGWAAVRTLGPAFLLGAIWWVRNILVYNGLDPLAMAAHNDVVLGQPRTSEWVATYGFWGVVWRFLRTTFNSFWGQFGWMAAPLPGWMYLVLVLFTLVTLGGLIYLLATRRSLVDRPLNPTEIREVGQAQRIGVMMAALFGLTILLYLGYNLTYVQHQGRYLFPALIPMGLGLGLAWGTLLRPVVVRYPPLRYAFPIGLTAVLFSLSLLALFTTVIPRLSP